MNEKYDAIIIGAGIGGLVCGCYLAKSGLKVLVLEQHFKAGGYCTSFQRKGYNFDVGVHYLGSLKKGILRKVLDDLELDLQFSRVDPCDKIIMPETVTYIKGLPSETKEEFEKSFPKESGNIEKFFAFIYQSDFLNVYQKTKLLTFAQILDEFFVDARIKATFSLLLENIGLSARIAAAVPAIILFREYIFDSGYYPAGGMQAFPDTLAAKLKALGGEVLCSRKVTKIITTETDRKVVLETGEEFTANTIVSNADATHTFRDLLDVKTKELSVAGTMVPSSPLFLVYLGLKPEFVTEKTNLWYYSTYDVDDLHATMSERVVTNGLEYVMCSFPSSHDLKANKDKPTATLFIHAPFKTKEFWAEHRTELAETMIHKASEVVKGLEDNIALIEYGTPHAFYRYTTNTNGSFVGWLATLPQSKASLLPQKTSVKGLYLVGHWASMGYPGYGGIPNVAFSGRKGALLILDALGKKTNYKDNKL